MARTSALVIVGSLGLAAVGLAGCYSPGGGFWKQTGGSTTYYSDELMQKTISVVDLRTGETVFILDVPVDKQLVIDFDDHEGDDPVNRPDLMRWEVMEQGKMTGKLHNAMSVPNAASRRVDVALHRRVQFASQPPQRALRTDELADRPDWWTPQGGPLPEDKTAEMYDN